VNRLTVPEPEIILYETGFADVDQLGREATGKALSDLVDRIEDPMVIALDGGWGSGKSFFLKCWVGEHLKREGNTTQTVYFDAFANDFMDEPLVSLLACLLNRFESKDTVANPDLAVSRPRLEALKETASKLRPAAVRMLTGIGAAVVKNYVGDLGDVFTDKMEEEIAKSTDGFWAAAQNQQNIMTEFGEAMKAVTVGPDGIPRKLVIVVDELDRCRPDYALALLEIIKHFFAVDHVHFVLGVNLRELENSVRARYGGGINAGLYLQKFVTLTMGLSDTSNDHDNKKLSVKYFEEASADLGIHSNSRHLVVQILNLMKDHRPLTLRAVQRIMVNLQISTMPSNSWEYQIEEELAVATLAILKTLNPEIYANIHTGSIKLSNMEALFDLNENSGIASARLLETWQLFLDAESYSKRKSSELVAPLDQGKQLSHLLRLKVAHLETFKINNAH
jgi:hypothetical protein